MKLTPYIALAALAGCAPAISPEQLSAAGLTQADLAECRYEQMAAEASHRDVGLLDIEGAVDSGRMFRMCLQARSIRARANLARDWQ